MTNPDSILKIRNITLPTNVQKVKAMSSSHVQMWELDQKEGWAPKNWYFQIEVLGNTLESPLDCKEIQPVNPNGNQSWILIGRTRVEAEAPILWPPDAKSQVIGKDPDPGEGRQEKGTIKDEMVGWNHWLNAHEFEQAPGDGEGQGCLACCSPWGCKELDMNEQLNKKKTDWAISVMITILNPAGTLQERHCSLIVVNTNIIVNREYSKIIFLFWIQSILRVLLDKCCQIWQIKY